MYIRNARLTKHRKKLLICLFTIFAVIVLNITIPLPGFVMTIYYWAMPHKGVFCHSDDSTDSLPDISDAHPKKGESIFFHETSCNSYINGKISITARQACAVESAARLNPNYEVYLLYASPGQFRDLNTESDRFLKALMLYTNIHIRHVNMVRYLRGTPVENLWVRSKMKQSQYAQSHTSDVLRFLTLWKYGGIYLDLDVIVLKNLKDLGTDYAGVESSSAVAAGILSFNSTGAGHDFVSSCLNDLKLNFKGNDWGYNGPGTITRLLQRICGKNKIAATARSDCQGFKIYETTEFYAIPWWNWKWFFDENSLENVLYYTNNSHIIHVWNKFSSSHKIPLSSNQPYLHFARKYCPSIIKECDEYF